jgi:hypothetical protein
MLWFEADIVVAIRGSLLLDAGALGSVATIAA